MFIKNLLSATIVGLSFLLTSLPGSTGGVVTELQNLPRSMLTADNVAVIVNQNNPKSLEVGKYYLNARKIPESNFIKVNIPPDDVNIKPEKFQILRNEIFAQLKPNIQAIVLVWTAPYKVNCNSITAAITMGYDPVQCKNTCAPGRVSKYFDAQGSKPFDEFGIRISMLLPVDSVAQAKALIDRGVISTFRMNVGTAYFLNTSDPNRNSRSQFFPKSTKSEALQLTVENINADSISDKQDVMFYFTGLANVPNLNSLNFLPGAIADHLTSTGGDLLGKQQMSSLKWLEAGATASYGSVSEPCNYWQKFSNPMVLLKHYLAGETAIESYWKSVAWPTQGVFIGEPLAAPYCRHCN